MVGGTTSGYSLIGSRHMAIKPMVKITIESTPAKIGRRMKKWEKFISFDFSGVVWLSTPGDLRPVANRHRLLGRHRHAGTNALQTVDNDHVARLQAGAHDAFAANEGAELHRAILDCVRRGQREHELLRLVRADGALLHQQRGMALAQGHADARKQAGHNATVRVWKHGAQKYAAGIGIEPIVE